MDEEFLKNCIDNGYENECLDYKLDIYKFNKGENSEKEKFLTDILAMANSNNLFDRYIIIGEKVKFDGERIKKGIDLSNVKDSAEYQQIVSENIEPAISVDFKILEYENKKYGIFKIYNCINKPYLLKKDYNTLKAGFMRIRHGSRNDKMTRFDLDSIYKLKKPIEKTNFKIYGMENEKISDSINIKKYNINFNLAMNIDRINEIIKYINNFVIDDIPLIDKNSYFNAMTSLSKLINQEENIELTYKDIRYIEQYIKANNIIVNENFFNIGNASRSICGLNTSIFGYHSNYNLNGSTKSIKKYKIIKELNGLISQLIYMEEFEEKLNAMYYIELVIKEIGNIADEEIEVNLVISTTDYMKVEEFPQVHESIAKMVNAKYSRELFTCKYNKKISDFRNGNSPKAFNINKIDFSLLGESKSEYKSIDGIYDYINYYEQKQNDKITLTFTIKNIKVNEYMIFPGRILLKNKIKKIEYFIVSKKSDDKIDGELLVD